MKRFDHVSHTHIPKLIRDRFNDWDSRLDCADNFRWGRVLNPFEMSRYNVQVERGCCGFVDEEMEIGGEVWLVGCNYGH